MNQIDKRISLLFKKCKQEFSRCMIFLAGFNAAENVPLLLSMNDYDIESDLRILWCFKNENKFIKRSGKSQRKLENNAKNEKSESNFDNFAFSHDITWRHYNDSDLVLGMTYDMCVFQDLECLTPNVIAKVIETVSGGGLVVFLISKLTKLSDFGSMNMDVHKKYRTFAFDTVDFRFNYRFLLSMVTMDYCIFLDDKMQLLPINLQLLNVCEKDGEMEKVKDVCNKTENKLKKLKERLCSKYVKIAALIDLCVTRDQAKSLATIMDGVDRLKFLRNIDHGPPAKKLKNTPHIDFIDKHNLISMVTAGRGRGKSALLGLTISAMLHSGSAAKVCVTSPSADSVSTLMLFVIRGLNQLGYKENEDFFKTTNGNSNSITMIEINNKTINDVMIIKQSVRYIQPTQAELVDGVDLLCIDETAAIPLPTVRQLLNAKSDFVLMSSTIHGYEGTGRSLSLKLMNKVKEAFDSTNNNDRFCEISLKTPIRYSRKDKIEKWLTGLLCLDCGSELTNEVNMIELQSIGDSQLFMVNRDVLFSGHPKAERFLHKLMSIYVSSHYKNTPNDLQMLCDSSSHSIFCLVKTSLLDDGLPFVCAVIQLAFEGSIDPVIAKGNIEKGVRPSGDMIPWTVIQQFSDYGFAGLSGARIVRIAVHPVIQRFGYGGRALKLLFEYFESNSTDLSTSADTKMDFKTFDGLIKEHELLNDLLIAGGVNLPNIGTMGALLKMTEKKPDQLLDYIGVSFGLTSDLLRFWKKNCFVPVYLRQTMNESTGEHSCIMIRPLRKSGQDSFSSQWLDDHNNNFSRRFCSLLSGPFKSMDSIMALEMLHVKSRTSADITIGDVKTFFIESDFVRIDNYLRNMIDYHAIMDLVFGYAFLFQTRKIPNVKLPKFQNLVLVGIGLQHKTVDELVLDLSELQKIGMKPCTAAEILGHLRECLRHLTKAIRNISK